MSDTDEEQEAPEVDTARGRGRFRDDPLSMFLAFSAVLLGLMYYLEQTGLQRIEDANVRAQQIGATTLDLDGCTTEAAGKAGAFLVVACASTADDAVRRAVDLAPKIAGFDAVLFVGSDHRLRCPLDTAQWPDACAEQNHPDVSEADEG